MSNNLVSTLQLYRTKNIGPKTFAKLIELYGDVDEAISHVPEMSIRGGRKTPLKIYSRSQIEDEIANAQKIGAKFSTIFDDNYPNMLRNVGDAPPVLIYRGNGRLFNKHGVAIVGSRNASSGGLSIARKIASEIGQAGYATISGLARGIDAAVHKASIETGTIAVIAGGIENIYPPENTDLYNEIAEKGLIITEQPYGTKPKAELFPRRNRIVAAMAKGCLVVEASIKSGSLITARMAGDYGREVFAIPGSPMDNRYSGPNKLIKDGACLVLSSQDIIDELAGKTQDKIFKEDDYDGQFNFAEKKPLLQMDIDANRAKIANSITTNPISLDSLLEYLLINVDVVMAVLLELEVAGEIEYLTNGYIVRISSN